jgi:hypothetical protein
MLVAWRSDEANQMLQVPVSPAPAVVGPVPVSRAPVLLGLPMPRSPMPTVRVPRALSPAVGERLATPA